MKKIVLSLLPLLFFCGCTDSESDRPVMEIVGVFIEGDEDEINYAEKYNRMPSLCKGDKVDILIELDGNGNDLYSFIVESIGDGLKTVVFFQLDEISEELSKENQLIFNDGISKTGLTVKAEILKDQDGEQLLFFFLNSKGLDSEGAEVHYVLPTQQKKAED